MNLGTAIVLLIVIAMVVLAIRLIVKKKGSCGCYGGCEGCRDSCTCCSMATKLEELV